MWPGVLTGGYTTPKRHFVAVGDPPKCTRPRSTGRKAHFLDERPYSATMSVAHRSRSVRSTPRQVERSTQNRIASTTVAVLPFVAVLAGVVVFFTAEPVYHASLAEDGPIEWATAAVYIVLVPSALLVARWRLCRKDWLGTLAFVGLGVGFFLIAGEEVSWGQRQLGFAGPEALVTRNIQGEANLHNLLGRYALHLAYIAVGLWGLGLGRVVARLIPVARPTWLYAPRCVRWTWFAPVTAYYVYVDYIGPALLTVLGPWFDRWAAGPARFQELTELILAFGFAFFVYDVLRLSKTHSDGAAGLPVVSDAHAASG